MKSKKIKRWVSGDWGSLPLEGGIEAAFKRDLENKVVTKEEVIEKIIIHTSKGV